MTNYIIPHIRKYQNIDDLLGNNNKTRSIFDTGECLSIDELLQENFVCIVGEPGIGKSRLVKEIKSHSSKKTLFSCEASELKNMPIPTSIEFCIIDALDEVEGNVFFSTLQLIKEYKVKNPDVKVLFTCRKHYVASYANHFASLNSLFYVELCRLRYEDVNGFIDNCSESTKENIAKSLHLKELLTIPRFLTYLLEYEEEKQGYSNVSELFEYMIGSQILNAVESYPNPIKNESIRILIQRVLEKVAFIMEISRKDQISKDELYTILDEVRGNMTQMLVASFDLLFFESRILKDTNGTLQFENTELQEYLAAKELCRQDNIESVLYDVAVQKDLKHIYPNWYDVIPHISYVDDNTDSFINIIKLIASYESHLNSDAFVSLLRYVDPSLLSLQQKNELFLILLEHYLHIPTYVGWRSDILKLMQKCYSSNSINTLKITTKQLNKLVLANICTILEGIAEENMLEKELSDYWMHEADKFIKANNEDKNIAALTIYNAINARNKLSHLSNKYNCFSKKVKEKYCNVTGYGKIADLAVADCWLSSCYEGNPYAINAVLNIEDPTIIYYAYNKIVKSQKLSEFFNPKGVLAVHYEFHLKDQFDIAWKQDNKSKILITKIIAEFVDKRSHGFNRDIYRIIKTILLKKSTGTIFVKRFCKSLELASILTYFETELIDAELLHAIEELLRKVKINENHINMILRTLTNKVRNDEHNKASISEYILRYSETFEQWDKKTKEEQKNKEDDSLLSSTYQSLSNLNTSKIEKYNAAYDLCKDLDFINKQDPQPLVQVIETFLNTEVNLDDTELRKKENNQFSISTVLAMIPYYAKALYHLGYHSLLKKHRNILTKTLPIACCTVVYDVNEIRKIYKVVIGKLSENEKKELVEWWKSRNDNFLDIRPDDIFTCITEYGIEALSFKLEEYIEVYVNYQDQDHYFAASKALELISQGYLNWKVEDYKKLFNNLKKDDIESVKMLCNAILIKKYQDAEAIRWRIEYLKNHITKSHNHETGHAYVLSTEEAEMTSNNPKMFRCFMDINRKEKLDTQMLDLFDYGLSLFSSSDTQEYASYLLKQIYFFFMNRNEAHYFYKLRKKVERFNSTNVSYLANNIMNDAEIKYLQKEKISIDKSVKQYNKCIEESHLEIRNDGDLRRYFAHIHSEVQKEIQDQGIYSLVSQNVLNEDFIQRELKNTIINKCCQMGLESFEIDREVALQDNKRTDLLIRYGFCKPIMVELKLLHNPEIQDDKKRHEYKKKFIQYTKATNACLSVFWVFDVHKNGCGITKFKDLEFEYKDLDNTRVLLTDCKCSSGIDTGLFVNKANFEKEKGQGE